MLTWHSDEILTRVKATPCVAIFGSQRPCLLPLLLSSPSSSSRPHLDPCKSQREVLSLHMEHSLRRHIRSQLSDPEPVDLCRTELTPTNSDSSSITADDTSKDISHHCAAPFQDQLTKWTDWQHNLYLDSLEASFVNELYHSMHLRSSSVQDNLKEADESKAMWKSCNRSGQFLIRQDGCWKKISHDRNEPMLESTGDSHVLAGNPLKFTSVERGYAMRKFSVHHCGLLCNEGHIRGSSTCYARSPRSSGKQHVRRSCYHDSVGNTAEGTDQNFKDEEHGARSSCVPLDKRLKTTSTFDASRNDQVVPIGKFYSSELSSSNNSSSENKGQHELLSELSDGFHLPKSNLHYFLRGS